ncbi:protein HGV2-like isoform X1 [Amblyomma americanum]
MAEASSPPLKPEGEGGSKSEPSVDAAMLLLQGKRHLLVQDYPSAVASLQEACQLLGTLYGETAKECGEAYLCYGRALLELARQETGVLGNALESEEEQDDDEDDDDAEGGEEKSPDGEGDAAGSSKGVSTEESEKKPEQSGSSAEPSGSPDVEKAVESKATVDGGSSDEPVVADATEVKAQGGGGEADAASTEEDAEEDLEKPEPALKDDIEPLPSEPGTSTAGPSGSSAPAPKDEEDVPNLQLAWEVLELAKIIFKRQAEEEPDNSREYRLKVADVLLKLGEISLESDNCEQAVEDLAECLNIQRELLEADSRQIAETHYQRGLALSFGGQYQEAAEDLRSAVRVLELRVENLTRFIEEGKKKERQGSLDEDPVWLAEREVEELQGLLPEVRARVEDTEDTIRQDCRALKDATIQKMRERLPATSPVKNSGSGPESSRPVNVITHLIKRKPAALQRTSDEGGCSAESPSATPKKVKSEVTDTNGESVKKSLALETPAANDCEKAVASPLKTVAS